MRRRFHRHRRRNLDIAIDIPVRRRGPLRRGRGHRGGCLGGGRRLGRKDSILAGKYIHMDSSM